MKICPQCETGYPDNAVTCPTHGGHLSEIIDLRPGMLVRKTYRIVRLLGKGGMGSVYLAQHELMDAPRALKFLSHELNNDEAFTRRFLREGRMLRQVRHKNVVDCGDLERAEDERLFFAMEFVDGPDLRGLIHQAGGRLDVIEALRIARGIAEGLGAAHALGMVHRDIKPENVLMARDKSGWTPKIADFGIVATVESSTVYKTTRGSLLTPPYAAPEQWRGTRASELDGRTDLYALGGVLFEMLTGRTVFEAENYESWLFEHLQTPPRPPSTLRPELVGWKGLDALVLRLLAKDREDRPRDVADLLGELDAVRPTGPERQPTMPEVRKPTVIEREPARSGPALIPSVEPEPERKAEREGLTGQVTRLSPELPSEREEIKPRRGSKWIPEVIIVTVVLMVFFFSWQESRTRDANLATSQPSQAADTQTPVTIPDATDTGRQGKELYKQKQYKDALPLLDTACTGGDGEACADLGMMYGYKLGVTQDVKKSASFFTRACDLNNPDGCYNIGNFYYVGTLNTADDARARPLLTKACDEGSDQGCWTLGLTYLQPSTGARDVPNAMAVFTKACDARLGRSCMILGQMYENGRMGVEQDYARTVDYFSKACEDGNSTGCYMMGNVYWSGHGVEKNLAKSDEYFKRACTMGETSACHSITPAPVKQ
jgi:serine/threonine protein kinase/TPR repeat protein